MNLQHVNVKLLVNSAAEVHLEPLIPIFHSWIRDKFSTSCYSTSPITSTFPTVLEWS